MSQIKEESSHHNHVIPLFIDEVKFEIVGPSQTGAQLRALVPVPEDRDLWLDVPGAKDDVLIYLEKSYDVKSGSHYYTAPSTINPGGI